MQTFFPTIVERDETGSYTAEVVGNGINGQGHSETDALTDAATSLQEIVWHAVASGEPIPAPVHPDAEGSARGRVALIQATLPAAEPVPV